MADDPEVTHRYTSPACRYLANAVLLGRLLEKHFGLLNNTTFSNKTVTEQKENSYSEGRKRALSDRDPTWHPSLIKNRLEEEGKRLHRRRELLKQANVQKTNSKCFLLRLSR